MQPTLYPTLFAILAILSGLGFNILFTYADKHDKTDPLKWTNLFLNTGWIATSILAVLYVSLLYNGTDHALKTAESFTLLGILLSVLVASASMMKNIMTTKQEYEHARKEKELTNLIYLKHCLKDEVAYFKPLLSNIQNGQVITKLLLDHMKNDTLELYKAIDHKDYFFHLKEELYRDTLMSLLSNLKTISHLIQHQQQDPNFQSELLFFISETITKSNKLINYIDNLAKD